MKEQGCLWSQPDASLERVFLGQFFEFLPHYNLTDCLQQKRPWFPEPGPHQAGLSLEFPPHPGRMEGLCFPTWGQVKFKGGASSGWASCSTLVGMLLPAMQRAPCLEYTKQSWVWVLHVLGPPLRGPRAISLWGEEIILVRLTWVAFPECLSPTPIRVGAKWNNSIPSMSLILSSASTSRPTRATFLLCG